MGMFLSSIAARRSSVGRSERAQDLSSIRIHVLSPEFEHTMFFSYSNIFNYGISLWHGPSSFHFSPQYQAGLGNWTCPGGLTPRWWHSCFGPSLSLLKDQGSLFHGEESSVRRRFLQVLRWTHNSFVLTSQCYLVSSAVPPSWWKERQASSRQQNQCSLWQGGSYELWLGWMLKAVVVEPGDGILAESAEEAVQSDGTLGSSGSDSLFLLIGLIAVSSSFSSLVFSTYFC